jgi:hypothetical protein
MWSNLRFFNGLKHELQLEQVDGIWEGKVYMPLVSAQLYETVNLFILENCKDGDGNAFVNTPIAPNSDINSFEFSWEPTGAFHSEDIIMYGYEVADTGNPIIKEFKSVSKDLVDFSHVISQDDKGVKSLDNLSNVAHQINIALNSTKEGIHKRVLAIKAAGEYVARIEFYGEVEEEDERLRVLLNNLGTQLDESDFMLFKSHDISEQAPNQILLNQKRKELLLELHNIKPFVGTYKAILNAIDFFGYDKITLKEYWINVNKSGPNFGKLHAIPVANSSVRGEMIRKRLKFKVPSATQKKTSRFSLVYRINEPNGKFDVWDIPKVTETFDYTPEEVIIKLYGLKNRLQRDYLPLEAKIVDITGEGDYFTQRSINLWKVENPIGFFTEGHRIKYRVFPENRDLFIEDTARVLEPSLTKNYYLGEEREQAVLPTNNFENFLALKPGEEAKLSEAQRTELKEVYREFYKTYYENDLNSWNSNCPIGCPVILDGMPSFDHRWDDANFVWDDAIDANDQLRVTWDNWWKKWVYEVEWIVDGPNGWHKEYRGPVDDYSQLPLTIPHPGKYTVEMRTYDLFGHMSFYKTEDLFEVKLKDIELYGVYEWLETNAEDVANTWDSKGLDWDKSGGYWDFPQDNNSKVDDNIATLYLTLDRANYIHMEEDQGIRFSTVRRYVDIYSDSGFSETSGPYQWGECKFTWNDTVHNWWDAMRVGPDLSASFKILNIEQGDTLRIEHINPRTRVKSIGLHTISSPTPAGPTDKAGWLAIIAELEGSKDPVISKFNYNPIFSDNTTIVEDNIQISGSDLDVNANGDLLEEYIRISGGDLGLNMDGSLTGDYIQISGSDLELNIDGSLINDTADNIALHANPQLFQNPYLNFILCVGQEYSKTYDFESVEIIKGNSSSEAAVGGEVHVKHYNPTWDNVKVFKDYAVVEKSTHVTISADISKFPGAKNPKWTITNLSNPEINDIYYNNMWLTYIFQDAGNYSIQLEAEDTYNNKNVVRRNMIKVK